MLFVLMRSRASHEKIITQNFAKEFHSRRGFIGAIAFHLAELKECRAVILFIERAAVHFSRASQHNIITILISGAMKVAGGGQELFTDALLPIVCSAEEKKTESSKSSRLMAGFGPSDDQILDVNAEEKGGNRKTRRREEEE